MKKFRSCLLFLLILLLSAGCAGCGEEQTADSDFSIFYLNKEGTKIVDRAYEPQADPADTEAMIAEFLTQLSEDSGDVEYRRAVQSSVEIMQYTLEGEVLTLFFNNEYNKMDKVEEVLVRAAIVRTMTQIDGVECLTFYVGDAPLVDEKGNPMGVMTNESFIENPGEQINSIQTSAIVLYFANSEGNGLVQETQEVHYSSNISVEKLVMEHLLEGPQSENAQSAIPEGTKLLNVSVVDGVCYVSLDEGFRNQNYNIEEPVVIYSIVNSLSELATTNKVQISVNGDTSGVYRDNFALDELYERDLDYVTQIEDMQIEIDDTEEVSNTGE